MLRIVLVSFVLMVLAAGVAHGDAPDDAVSGPRSGLLLNGVWQFAPAPDGDPPAGGWRDVRVPHRSREFEADPPTSGWYRTGFRVPPAWDAADSRIVLDLSRVRHYARVLVDGEPVGEHYGMRTPFEIDLTDRVKPGGRYELTVYTHNCSGKYAHPSGRQLSPAAEKALDTVFWHTSAATVGIEGDVRLRYLPAVRVEDVYVVTSVREKTLTAEVTVVNRGDDPFAGTLKLNVVREGKVELTLSDAELSLLPRQTAVVKVRADWQDPILWGRPPYGRPVLYFLRTRLSESGERVLTDERFHRFGFREVWTDGDEILLNGEPVFPWGDHSIPYVHERQWLTRKLPFLAGANCSFVEHHRYNAPSVLYDVADELGALVISSNFCVGTGQVPRNLPDDEMGLVIENHRRVAREWIRKDRNHPSILIWSATDNWQPKWAVPLLREIKAMDTTRIAEATYNNSPPEVTELVDCYRLFAEVDQMEAAIAKIRSADVPRKPIRIGEAGIFSKSTCPAGESPPIPAHWMEFIDSLAERDIVGLHTFYLTDMDYRGFDDWISGMLSDPIDQPVSWPAQSGLDARVDPFGEGAQPAWGKAHLYVNWFNPDKPVARPTHVYEWWAEKFRELVGRDVGPLSETRVPEAIVTVTRGGAPAADAQVFVAPLAGQGLAACGVRADSQGRAWFVLPEPGEYEFRCEDGESAGRVTLDVERRPVGAEPGYGHIQRATIELD